MMRLEYRDDGIPIIVEYAPGNWHDRSNAFWDWIDADPPVAPAARQQPREPQQLQLPLGQSDWDDAPPALRYQAAQRNPQLSMYTHTEDNYGTRRNRGYDRYERIY